MRQTNVLLGHGMKFIHLQKSNCLINLGFVPRLDIVFENGWILLRVADTFRATRIRDYQVEKPASTAEVAARIEFYEAEITRFLDQANTSGVLTFNQ